MSRLINQLQNDRLTPRPTSACVTGDLHVVDFGGHYATKPARNNGEASGP
jgi:hypothetical protein